MYWTAISLYAAIVIAMLGLAVRGARTALQEKGDISQAWRRRPFAKRSHGRARLRLR
jgi:hypothetical protein